LSEFNAKAAHAMRSVFDGAKKGALVCESPEAKRLVFFENGDLVGARSNLPSGRFGAVLIREGRITEADLTKALGFVRSGHKLGEILVELDYLKAGEIERYVRIQILEIACAVLTSPSTRLVFSEVMEVEAATLSPISIGSVFLTAVQRLPDVKLYRDEVMLDDYVLAQTDVLYPWHLGWSFHRVRRRCWTSSTGLTPCATSSRRHDSKRIRRSAS